MSNEIQEVITLGDKVINEKDITPSHYFDYVKGLKKNIDYKEQDLIIDTGLKMINKAKIIGQTDMCKELVHQINLAMREINVAKKGFDIYVDRKDIERYIDKVEAKSIKIIDLPSYTREIPDEVIDKISLASELFDKLYVVFTDYTKKETKKVAKERRDKDPIIFGAFLDPDSEKENKIYVENRLFFIADWVEEKCDLTLEQIVRDVKDKDNKDITYKVSTLEDEENIKKYLASFSEPIEKQEPVSLFEKVKKTVKRGRPRKKEIK